MFKQAKNRYIHIFLIALILSLVMTAFVSKKQIGHIDEFLSYSLANCGYMGRNHPEIFDKSLLWYAYDKIRYKNDSETSKTRDKIWNEPLLFIMFAGGNTSLSNKDVDYMMMPNEAAKFNLPSVNWNQSFDVHPPLYYMLLNIVCSTFDNNDKFSPWHGLSLNLFIFFFTLPLVYWLMWMLSKGNHSLSLFAMCAYGLSAGSTVAFLRMYMLLTFFTLLYTCLILKFFQDREDENFSTHSKTYALSLFLTIVLGSLSHHYFFLYMGISGLFLCVYLIFARKKRYLIDFLKISIPSVVVSLLLFPFTIVHLFFGEHSATDIVSRYANSSMILEVSKYIGEYLTFVKHFMFGGAANFILSFLLTALLILYINRKKFSAIAPPKEIYFLVATIMSFLVFVALTTKYHDERYIMNLYPIFGALFVYLFYVVYKAFFENIKFKPALILILLILMANNNVKNISNYLYLDSTKRYAALEEYKNIPCVYVYDDKDFDYSPRFGSFILIRELSLYPTVDFVKYYNLNDFLSKIDGDSAMVYFCSFKHEKYDAYMPEIEQMLKNTSRPYKMITNERGYPVYKLDLASE